MLREVMGSTPGPAEVTRLAVLLFSDIVASAELKGKVGDPVYKQLLDRHNALFESDIAQTPGARVIKHTGDGYFAEFRAPSEAVRFALRFQRSIQAEDWGPTRLHVRIGVHEGEVTETTHAGAADIVGTTVDATARLMSLATGRQILLTQQVFNDARQYVRDPGEGKAGRLRWLSHGPYLFKGIDDPLQVCEVGLEGDNALEPPRGNDKVRRVVPHDQEPLLGWRPGLGLEIRGRPGWVLEKKLGEGGFGEVWLGQHAKLKDRHVFKFCFNAERLRSLKREYTLFRLLREALGDRPDIARLIEVKLDELPFFLESEYAPGGDLLDWSEARGGIKTMPLRQRLELVATVADAVAAAHSVGVLHKDIKPPNILIDDSDGTPRPRLSDFGIGVLEDRSRLAAHSITETGFTQITEEASGYTFTRMYSPPEALLRMPFTTQGDVYALGVLTFQMCVGDLTRPLASGWERDIDDELLRQDIGAMVEGDPERRVATAAEVAQRLRSFEARKAAEARRKALAAAADRRLRRARRAVSIAVVMTILLVAVGMGAYFHIRRIHAEQARTLAAFKEAERQRALAQSRFDDVRELAHRFLFNLDPELAKLPGATPARAMLVQAALDYLNRLAPAAADDPMLSAELAGAYKQVGDIQGNRNYANLGETADALTSYSKALNLWQRLADRDPSDKNMKALGEGYRLIGSVHGFRGEYPDSLAHHGKAYEIFQKLADKDPSDAVRQRDLGRSFAELGFTMRSSGDLEGAVRNFDAAAGVYERLVAAYPDDARSAQLFAAMLSYSAGVRLRIGDAAASTDATGTFQKAVALALTLHEKHPDSRLYSRDLVQYYGGLAVALQSRGDISSAMENARAGQAIAQRMADFDRADSSAQTALGAAEVIVGDLLQAQEKWAEALECYRRNLAICRNSIERDPTNARLQGDYVSAVKSVVAALMRSGDRAGAQEACAAAIAFAQRLRDADGKMGGRPIGLVGVLEKGLADLSEPTSRPGTVPPEPSTRPA